MSFMSMMKFVLLILCMVVACSSAQCPPCDCFPVSTTNTALSELLAFSPLYSQAASIMSKGANIDSVCLRLTSTCTNDNVLTEQANTFIDGSSSRRASIQTTNSTGRFYVIGPTRSYYDSVLGSPCKGTYTIYRCPVTGQTCVTDAAMVDVIVVSTRMVDYKICIEKGKAIAQETFEGLEFYDLPKNSTNPCQCDVPGCYYYR